MRESLLLQKYKGYLLESKVSTGTVDNYVADVVFFLDWLATYLPSNGYSISTLKPSTYISYVDRDVVGEFTSHLSKGTFTNSTVARKVAGLRSFFKFVVSSGYLEVDPFSDFNMDPLSRRRSLLNSFRLWLKKQEATDLTIKNYISDVRHFLNAEAKLAPDSVREYLVQLKVQYKPSSYKRKLAGLRKFIEFMEKRQKLSQLEARNLRNALINKSSSFKLNETEPEKSYIKKEKKIDIKPTEHTKTSSFFSSNISLMLLFLILSSNVFLLGRMNTSLSSAISAATDVINSGTDSIEEDLTVTVPFSGKLRDSYGIPLSYENEFSFSLYATSDGVDPIYSSGRCTVAPANSGNFTIIVGKECGRPIPYLLLQQYPEIYLGVSMGFGPELNPRIQLKRFDFGYSPPTPTPTPQERSLPLFLDVLSATTSADVLDLATDSANLPN